MQTQTSKKSGNKTSSRNTSKSKNNMSSDFSRGMPSFSNMKKEAIRMFKDEATQKLSSISAFLPEGVADDATQYAQQAVRWLRKNPGAATALAVLSGVAVGAVVRQSLVGVSSREHR